MSLSRRGIFGLFAGAPVAAAAASLPPDPAPKAEFYVGQVRAVHSHYETKLAPQWFGGSSYAQLEYATEAVAVMRHEQWNGKEWLPIAEPTPQPGE